MKMLLKTQFIFVLKYLKGNMVFIFIKTIVSERYGQPSLIRKNISGIISIHNMRFSTKLYFLSEPRFSEIRVKEALKILH